MFFEMNQQYADTSNSPLQIPEDARTVALQDMATILRAPLFKTQSGRNRFPFRVASIKDFPEAGYLPTPERDILLSGDAEKAQRFALQPFDLLVITVGSIGHVTVVPSDCEANWIPATNMYVVRFTDEEKRAQHARAVYAVLKSPGGQATLSGLARGRGIQIVPKKVFARIQVPELADDILSVTEHLWNREAALYQESQNALEAARAVFRGLEVPSREPIAG